MSLLSPVILGADEQPIGEGIVTLTKPGRTIAFEDATGYCTRSTETIQFCSILGFERSNSPEPKSPPRSSKLERNDEPSGPPPEVQSHTNITFSLILIVRFENKGDVTGLEGVFRLTTLDPCVEQGIVSGQLSRHATGRKSEMLDLSLTGTIRRCKGTNPTPRPATITADNILFREGHLDSDQLATQLRWFPEIESWLNGRTISREPSD